MCAVLFADRQIRARHITPKQLFRITNDLHNSNLV
jgi:hypothetical protein